MATFNGTLKKNHDKPMQLSIFSASIDIKFMNSIFDRFSMVPSLNGNNLRVRSLNGSPNSLSYTASQQLHCECEFRIFFYRRKPHGMQCPWTSSKGSTSTHKKRQVLNRFSHRNSPKTARASTAIKFV